MSTESKSRRWIQKVTLATIIAGSLYAAQDLRFSNPFRNEQTGNPNSIGYDPIDCKQNMHSSDYLDLKEGQTFIVAVLPVQVTEDRKIITGGQEIEGVRLGNPNREYRIGVVGQTTVDNQMQKDTIYRIRIDGKCLE